jgi:biopolymer transport protein ExbD
MSLKKKSKITADFNMSSMTDIVFLLLIFFILTSTVVKEPILKVVLPKGVNDSKLVKEPIRIFLNAEGQYAIGEKKNVALADLPFALEQELTKNPDAAVSIHADKSVIYERVMELVSIANKSGSKVVLALEKEN